MGSRRRLSAVAIAAILGLAVALVAAPAAPAAPCSGPNLYPGDAAAKSAIAQWMGRGARDRTIPAELPVMAALVESNLQNLNYGDADALGFFQMRESIWNHGEYTGYPDDPDLQLKWFIDQALAVRAAKIAAGDAGFGSDPSKWGEWVADVERPAESQRYRYQLRLEEARGLIGELCTDPTPSDPPGERCRGLTVTVLGTENAETLRGTSDADVIAARGGKDTIRGLGGDDVICAGDGPDKLLGGAGKDRLYGEAGNDVLRGGAGKDKLAGGAGKDSEQQ